MKLFSLFILLSLSASSALAKEIALSFDDAPVLSSLYFETHARTDLLIQKLKALNVPSVLVVSNACRRDDAASVVQQMKKYTDAGHLIGNHTCTHPRLDGVGVGWFSKDSEKNDQILSPLLTGQKFFRFPYLNEGIDEKTRNLMRDWLKKNNYRNGSVSIADDDYIFSWAINQAKENGKKIDYPRVRKLFVKYLLGATNFYDDLAVKNLGRSPKHVILLHEMDATVMFLDSLVTELRKQGWTIISAEDAYKDKIYSEQPKNLFANNGIVAQLVMEKTGQKVGYNHVDEIKAELIKILHLEDVKLKSPIELGPKGFTNPESPPK